MQSPRLVIRLSFALSLGVASSSAQLHVNLFNDSHVPVDIVAEAQREVDRIYESAKVRISWRECPIFGEGAVICFTTLRPAIDVRLYGASEERRFRLKRHTFGFAMSEPDREKYYAVIFPGRVAKTASESDIRYGRLLGYVIAHEIGHVLLTEGRAHAVTGLMKTPWQAKELDDIKRGTMTFLPAQTALFHETIARKFRAGDLVANASNPRSGSAVKDEKHSSGEKKDIASESPQKRRQNFRRR